MINTLKNTAAGKAVLLLLSAAVTVGAAARATAMTDQSADTLAHDILKQLVEINTTDSVGNVTTAAEAIAKRFRDAGFPAADVVVVGPDNPRKQNVVVRLHGTGQRKPILMIGHLDVVEARREDWTTDPFKLVEKDGYFYGRGSLDMKDGDAIMATTLLRMRQEGFKPDRDLILALTADEEGGCCNGVSWLMKNRRDLVNAEFVLNHDGFSITADHGVPRAFELGATEKVYADFQLTTTNPGGHSSLPRPDNAIYELAHGLDRIEKYRFPFELNNVTRAYFERMAELSGGERAADMRAILKTPPDEAAIARLSRDPTLGSIMRTTCVATRLAGGHANNALPQTAEAVINCRIMPGHSQEEVRQDLIRILEDPKITVRYIADDGQVLDKASDRRGYPPPPLVPEVRQPLDKVVAALWPGLKVIPAMDAGASDSIYTEAAGLPSYGISGISIDADRIRMHGRDECVSVASFYKGVGFFYRYLKSISSP
jgi:acetylornithine deacetylase/succinyl-diaminopimelate desuccinylase-like protein